jgi:hypothetical protein
MHRHCYPADTASQDRVVTIVIRVTAGRPRDRGSIPDSGNSPPSSLKRSNQHLGPQRLRAFPVVKAVESSD